MKRPISCDEIIRCCEQTPELAGWEFANSYTFSKIQEVFERYCGQFGHDDVVSRFNPPPNVGIDGIRVRCCDGIVDLIFTYRGDFEIQRNFYVPKDEDIHLTGNSTGTPLIDI